jgi:hypothetical protein
LPTRVPSSNHSRKQHAMNMSFCMNNLKPKKESKSPHTPSMNPNKYLQKRKNISQNLRKTRLTWREKDSLNQSKPLTRPALKTRKKETEVWACNKLRIEQTSFLKKEETSLQIFVKHAPNMQKTKKVDQTNQTP